MRKLHVLLLVGSLLLGNTIFAQYDNMFGVTLERYTTTRPVPARQIIDGMVGVYGDFSRISSGYHVYSDSVNPFDTDAPIYGHEGIYIERGGVSKLRVEYRTPPAIEGPDENDTFPLYVYNLGQTSVYYQFEILANVDPAYLQIGKIIDNYPYPSVVPTEVALPLNGSVDLGTGPKYGSLFYPFEVNPADPDGTLSKNPRRFSVVTSKNATYSRFAFTHFGGVRDAGGIHLDWDAIGESMVATYEVQHLDRGQFVTLGFATPLSHSITGSVGIEAQTLRIKATLKNSTVVYSDTLKLPAVLAEKPFSILPNITTGSSSDRDLYGPSELVIFNTNGTPVLKKPIVGQTGERVNLPNLSRGLYIVKVGKMVQKLVIE
jgi:hypothetical protein